MKRLVATLLVFFAALPAVAAPVHHARRHSAHHSHPAHARQAAAADNSVKVWVNTNSGVYHFPGERWYGNTKEGKYMTEKAAIAEGDRATENGQ